MYYRPTPKNAQCNDIMDRPTGWNFVEDSVFVIAMLTQPGKVVITSGSNQPHEVDLPAGVTTISAPMGVGAQAFKLERSGATVVSGTAGLQISNSCTVSVTLLSTAAVSSDFVSLGLQLQLLCSGLPLIRPSVLWDSESTH